MQTTKKQKDTSLPRKEAKPKISDMGIEDLREEVEHILNVLVQELPDFLDRYFLSRESLNLFKGSANGFDASADYNEYEVLAVEVNVDKLIFSSFCRSYQTVNEDVSNGRGYPKDLPDFKRSNRTKVKNKLKVLLKLLRNAQRHTEALQKTKKDIEIELGLN